jgi:hypothetical protein
MTDPKSGNTPRNQQRRAPGVKGCRLARDSGQRPRKQGAFSFLLRLYETIVKMPAKEKKYCQCRRERREEIQAISDEVDLELFQSAEFAEHIQGLADTYRLMPPPLRDQIKRMFAAIDASANSSQPRQSAFRAIIDM